MALVKLTDELRKGILASLASVFNIKINDLREDISSMGDELYANLLPTDLLEEIQHYNERIASTLNNRAEDLGQNHYDLQCLSQDTSIYVNLQTQNKKVELYFTFSSNKFLPKPWSNINAVLDLTPELLPRTYNLVLSKVKVIEQLEEERDKLYWRMQKLLYVSKTLNQVHKQWPSVVDYIEEETKDKLLKPHLKKKRSKDLNKETQVGLIRARILNHAE